MRRWNAFCGSAVAYTSPTSLELIQPRSWSSRASITPSLIALAHTNSAAAGDSSSSFALTSTSEMREYERLSLRRPALTTLWPSRTTRVYVVSARNVPACFATCALKSSSEPRRTACVSARYGRSARLYSGCANTERSGTSPMRSCTMTISLWIAMRKPLAVVAGALRWLCISLVYASV